MTSFTIGHPKLIHPTLIATLVDLQSTIIYTTDGLIIGWIHEHTENIEFAEGYRVLYHNLIKESELRDKLIGYTLTFFKIDGAISYRQWDVKTKFIYPAPPPPIPTIETEDQY